MEHIVRESLTAGLRVTRRRTPAVTIPAVISSMLRTVPEKAMLPAAAQRPPKQAPITRCPATSSVDGCITVGPQIPVFLSSYANRRPERATRWHARLEGCFPGRRRAGLRTARSGHSAWEGTPRCLAEVYRIATLQDALKKRGIGLICDLQSCLAAFFRCQWRARE